MTDMELRMLMAESVQKCHRVVFEKYCETAAAARISRTASAMCSSSFTNSLTRIPIFQAT